MEWENAVGGSPISRSQNSDEDVGWDCGLSMCSGGSQPHSSASDEDGQDSIVSGTSNTDESESTIPPNLADNDVEYTVHPERPFTFSVPDITAQPYFGMEFEDQDEAYNFYNMYAKEKGFSVRKGRVERSRSDKRILSRAFVCSNAGEKYTRDKRRLGKDYQPRTTKKTNCGAAMRVKAINGKWKVDILVLEHNHDLVDPRESYRLRSHQKATKGTVQLIERLHRCGITPSQIFTILKDFSGGEQHTGISDVRFRSICRAKRRNSLGIDCKMALSYLDTKRASDPNFFYSISVNKEEELTGLFWVDGRAREQYRTFGDVIVFDTTYRKNKYKFPFAPFTGVNHHMQCTLFGCGLIADETKESFEWLFTTWVQAMHNVHPKAILTDEDPGIMRAVKKVFPSTVHRLCSWHLEKHRHTHMGPLYRKFPDLRQMFHTCVHNSTTPAEFEISWENMLNTFSLQNHKWLKKKFKVRKLWVPCYFPDTFFAGMTTTQRAESMNNYFKGYFSSSTPINEFITQYEEAVRKRRGFESKADVLCLTCKPSCSTTHPLEMHAAEVYTNTVFNVFKEEWKVCLGVEVRQCDVDPPVKRYETFFNDTRNRRNLNYVVDNQELDETTCTCKLLEQTGVLCKHILKVYVITDRRRIPDCYILPRWTMAARFSVDDAGIDVRAPSFQPRQQPVWVLNDMARRLVSEGSLSVERFGLTFQGMTDLLNAVLKLEAVGPTQNYESGLHSNATTASLTGLRANDPSNHSITRGRPVHSRITSTVENLQHRRSYHCSACGQTGHNVAKCPQVNAVKGVGMSTTTRQPMQIDLNDPPTQEQDN